MVPFATVKPRLNRIASQVSQELNKQVNFQIICASGEMDRNQLDKLTPALEHMLRNAIDHGLGSAKTGNIKIKLETQRQQSKCRYSG